MSAAKKKDGKGGAMRIALVIERMAALRGGREVSTAQIASRLAGLGHDVTIVCQAGSWEGRDVKLLELGARGLFRFQQAQAFTEDTGRAVAHEGFDIVHAMLPAAWANVYQPRGGTIPGQIDASVRRWGLAGGLRRRLFEPMNLRRRRLGELERELVSQSKVRCLAVSKMVAEEFARYYDRRQGVSVVFNGVETPRIDDDDWRHWRQKHRYELGLGPDDPVFVSVASNFALKGMDQAVRAFAKWRGRGGGGRDPRLVVIGRDLTDGYQRTAGLLGVGREVVFVPPTKDIFEWYAAADACVLLSWYDPCSRTVLEAVSCGLPAITTRYNGASEALAGGAGIVVESPDDTRAIIDAFEELSDSRRRADLKAKCLAIAGQVSMERHVNELCQVYREVAGR